MMKWKLHQAERQEFWVQDQFMGLDSLTHPCEHTFSTPSLSFPSYQMMRLVLALGLLRRYWDVKSRGKYGWSAREIGFLSSFHLHAKCPQHLPRVLS